MGNLGCMTLLGRLRHGSGGSKAHLITSFSFVLPILYKYQLNSAQVLLLPTTPSSTLLYFLHRQTPLSLSKRTGNLINMPLVVPGINNTSGDGSGWMTKLVGKKLTEHTTDHASFAKKELPRNHRVVEDEGMMTMDHDPNRCGPDFICALGGVRLGVLTGILG